jgi:hypothetical protein
VFAHCAAGVPSLLSNGRLPEHLPFGGGLLNSTGINRAAALAFDCSRHSSSKVDCMSGDVFLTPEMNGSRQLCTFIQTKDPTDPDSFSFCVKTKLVVDNLCKLKPEQYGCPVDLGCDVDPYKLKRADDCGDKAKGTGYYLEHVTSCKAAECESVYSTSEVGCTGYHTDCSALVFVGDTSLIKVSVILCSFLSLM